MASYKPPVMLDIKPNPPEGELHLKPCPFCGKEDPVYWQYETAAGPRWKVFCLGEECGGCVDTGYSKQRHHVTAKWNRRASETRERCPEEPIDAWKPLTVWKNY